MNSMGRWLPAILLFGLTTLCSCAEEPDNAYPGNTQNKALKAWMTQNRPDLLENYQEEGEYYVDVVSLGDLADSAILETESWVWYDITGRDLQGEYQCGPGFRLCASAGNFYSLYTLRSLLSVLR